MAGGDTGREVRVAETFVFLAETLVSGAEVVEVLGGLIERCVDLLDVTAGGIMLADQHGDLRIVAASSDQARFVELLELQNNEGPCLDAYRQRTAVRAPHLIEEKDRWPNFVAAADAAGFAGAYGLPLRLRDEAFGAMNLFRDEDMPFEENDITLAQALADVATIALLSKRETTRRDEITAQLQSALDSRIIVEQAKGVLAERAQIGMHEAFTMLRRHARNTNTRLSEVARAVTAGELELDIL